jgi:hypothetical protein
MKALPIVALLAVATFTSCTASSGVVPLGGDKYMIARSQKGTRGDAGRVKAAAIKEAGEFCRKNGKVMKITSTKQQDMKPFQSDAQAEVEFLALDPNDPRAR